MIINKVKRIGYLGFKKAKYILSLEKVVRPTFSNQYVTVFSHPRSGTHFLEAFIARNFYENENFETTDVKWGHWANRQIKHDSNKYYKLFGSHVFPTKTMKKIDYPMIYIYRDGRAVAYSIWKTENFINPKYKNISFTDFLREKLDWKGSPAFRSKEKYTIAEHWEKHVIGWKKISKQNKNILIIRYEDLVDNPYSVYKEIHQKFFSNQKLKEKHEIDKVLNPLGLKPNRATKDSWKNMFTELDKTYFESKLANNKLIQ
jgi:hypothetical protein